VSSEARSLVAVSAGVSQPSSTRLLADRLVAATERSLRERGVDVSTEVVELRDLAQDLVNNLLTGFPSERLRETIERTLAADGLIAVTPIFSASYSGLFKLFFDVVERDRLAGMPVLLGATGGTARHSLALEHAMRPLFAYLGAATVPTAVYAAAEDWGQADRPADIGLRERIERAGGELATAVTARAAPLRRDEFEDPIPFEDLLRGG
jgi:FMN reductase